MPPVEILNNLIASQHSAFIAGLIAAFTPCTLALIPIFLYRFDIWKIEGQEAPFKWGDLVKVLIAFMISLALSGFFFQQLLSSHFVNLTRLALGNTLLFIGLLQLSGKLNLQFISNFTNPWALGFITPWVVSLSPCVLPYFSALLGGAAITGDTVLKFVLFGLGLLTPAIAVAIIGDRLLRVLRRSQPFIGKIQSLGGWLIVFTGMYLSLELVSVSQQDILLSHLLLGVVAIFIGTKVVARNPTLSNYAQCAGILILISVSGLLLVGKADPTSLQHQDLIAACITKETPCDICIPTSLFTNLVVAWIAWLWLVADRPGRKLRFKNSVISG